MKIARIWRTVAIDFLTKGLQYSSIQLQKGTIHMLYDLNKVKEYLDTKYIGQTIIQYEQLNSTSQKAKTILSKCPEGTVIMAQTQTNCKMRFGRTWDALSDKNIYMSIILKYKLENCVMSKFETIASASVCNSVNQIFDNIESKIKWPNDIIVNCKKIGSICCDKIEKKNKIEGIIICIGINVNMDEDEISEEMKNTETSVKIETGQESIDREMLIAYILNNFETYYQELKDEQTIVKASCICMDESYVIGMEVEIIKPGKKTVRKVKATAIDEDGRMIIINEKGNEELLNSAEVSLRYEPKY